VSRLARRPVIDHQAAAANLRAKPGKWLLVGEYRSGQSAVHMAWAVRAGWTKSGTSPYAPAGSFEARTRLTEYGAALLACYVGPTDPPGLPTCPVCRFPFEECRCTGAIPQGGA
jgi:hypothetical protein